jgi:PAS domain-containing protein
MKIMQPEQIERHLQRLKEEQQLILNQVDNAIALFDSSYHLVLFNQKFANLGTFCRLVSSTATFSRSVGSGCCYGYWSEVQYQQLQSTLPTDTVENVSFSVEQPDGTHLDVNATLTSNGGCLYTFRDVTAKEQARRSTLYLCRQVSTPR